MLLRVEKGIRRGNVTAFINIQMLITNTWMIMLKMKNCLVLNIGT